MVEGKTFSKIKKRDGRVVKFDSQKVTQAIQKAGEVTGEFDEKAAKKLTLRVLTVAHHTVENKIPSVEEIQDIVEEVLLNSSYVKTAKSYIIYRDQHDKIRQIADSSNVNLVDEYLSKLDWQVNENSNMSYSLQGMNNYVAEEVTKVYWLNKIYPENIREAYLSGDFHIHDLGFLGAYCVGWDLEDLLMVGFKGIAGKIESSPAKHFRTALGQIVNFFYTTQGETAGAQAFSSFDTLLAPFVKYDKLDYKQVKQSMQEFVFNINVPTRVGFQTPFTNITMDLIPPKHMAKKNVIIGGKVQKEKYGDFKKEMDMLNKAFLEVMEEGDAKGRVFTFPIPTYNITKEFDWEDKNLEKLWEITAKYGIPNFSNYVNSDMSPDDARSMCCRLRLDNRELRKRGGGLFGSNPMTGSIGVVTMNLPRMGYVAKDEKEFFEILKKNMDLAKESLEIKRKVIEKFTEGGLYPYSRFYLRSVYERFKEYWKNHFSTIGLLGMSEACSNLLGEDITTEKGNDFAKRVLVFMRDIITEYQKETDNMYNLEATPAEGTSYRLALKDQKKYPGIIFANPDRVKSEDAPPFYTNSSQLPVNFTNDVFEELELQDDIQSQYTGGTNLHFFVGEKINSPKVVKDLVNKICSNYKLSYFTMTPTFSVCPEHGYIAGEHFKCPKCKGDADVYSRTVGYIRPVQYWNKGKVEEFALRKTFKINDTCAC
jgi:ribonucleoside-triphosphate reductase (formate)